MTVREVIARLIADGWYEVDQRGSHKQFKHATKPGRTTVPMHKGDIPIWVVISIEKQSGVRLR